MSGRRQVRLSYKTEQAFIVGFTGRASHLIYPLESCGVLQTELAADHTASQLGCPAFARRTEWTISINLLSSGADILLLQDETLTDKVLTALSAGLNSSAVCRLSVRQPESDIPLLLAKQPRLFCRLKQRLAAITYPSPGSFAGQ